MQLLILLSLLPALASAIDDFDTCDGDTTKLCFEDSDCDTYFTDAICAAAGGPVIPGPGITGCCTGGTADKATTTTAPEVDVVAAPCVDKLNPLTGISDCPASAYLCRDNVYRNFMTVQCPKTCGYCTGSSSSGTGSSTSCFDRINSMTGVSDCPAQRSLCTNAVYLPLMQVQCPLTCGFCTSG